MNAITSCANYPGKVHLPPGFANKRNSCFVSSILQCFFNVLPLKQLCTNLLADHPDECSCLSEGIIREIIIPMQYVDAINIGQEQDAALLLFGPS